MAIENKILNIENQEVGEFADYCNSFGWEVVSFTGTFVALHRDTQHEHYSELVENESTYQSNITKIAELEKMETYKKAKVGLIILLFILLIVPGVIYLIKKKKEKKKFTMTNEERLEEIVNLKKTNLDLKPVSKDLNFLVHAKKEKVKPAFLAKEPVVEHKTLETEEKTKSVPEEKTIVIKRK